MKKGKENPKVPGRRDQKTDIAYQNKDVFAKTVGDQMVGKPLSVFGWDTDLVVERLEPTNLPAIQADELRMDNLFVLSDGSLAIIDYESAVKPHNVIKYMQYVVRILEARNLKPGTKIRVYILYTADVESAQDSYNYGCIQFQMHPLYLVKVNSDAWLEEIKRELAANTLSFKTMVHLMMLPMTYKGEAEKNAAIRKCVDLAEQIPSEYQDAVLAGLVTFSDKFIYKEMRDYLGGKIMMTKVARDLIEKGRAEGRVEEKEANLQSVVNMLKSLLPDVESVWKKVTSEENFKDVPLSKIKELY